MVLFYLHHFVFVLRLCGGVCPSFASFLWSGWLRLGYSTTISVCRNNKNWYDEHPGLVDLDSNQFSPSYFPTPRATTSISVLSREIVEKSRVEP